jgi:hypothetical protein
MPCKDEVGPFLASESGKRQSELLGLVLAYLGAFFEENLRGQVRILLDEQPSDSAVRIQVFTPMENGIFLTDSIVSQSASPLWGGWRQ